MRLPGLRRRQPPVRDARRPSPGTSPTEYKGAIDYVEVRGRTKIVVRGTDQRLHPEPDVRRRGPARAPRRSTSAWATRRASRTGELIGEPMKCIPAFREPGARIELMDELGIDRALMFPTLASLLEERLRDDPELIHAVVHSLNEWLYETWPFNYEDRIFTTPVITLPIVDKAIEELEWVRRAGRQDRAHPPRAGARLPRLALVRASRSSTRSGSGWSSSAILVVDARLATAATPATTSDWTGPTGDAAVPARRLPDDDHAKRPDRGRDGGRWSATALLTRFPDLRIAVDRERRRLGRAASSSTSSDTYKKMPQALRRGPGRGVQAQHLHQPVPRGRPRRPDRRHRRRPRAVRLRLPAPRGPGRAVQLRRPPARGPARRRRPPRSWAATWPADRRRPPTV